MYAVALFPVARVHLQKIKYIQADRSLGERGGAIAGLF